MKNKNGISLIVLVITIIVMIILAGAVVVTLGNSGIISKANEAVNATDLANIQDLASMLWADAYLDNVDKLNGEALKNTLEDAVIIGLKAAKVDTTKYDIEVTVSGVTVSTKKESNQAVNEYGFYYNVPYIEYGDWNGAEIAYVFYPDGELLYFQPLATTFMSVWDPDSLKVEYAKLTATCNEAGSKYEFSEDGSTAVLSYSHNEDTLIYKAIGTEHGIYYGEEYISAAGNKVVFEDNGTAIYTSASGNTQTISNFVWTYKEHLGTTDMEGYACMVAIDGNSILAGAEVPEYFERKIENTLVPTEWANNVTAIVDGVPIPKGFIASPYEGENRRSGGLVIYELEDGKTTLKEGETQFESWTTRNQFVWVPVDKVGFKNFISRTYKGESVTDNGQYNQLGAANVYWEVIVDRETNMPKSLLTDAEKTFMSPETLQEVQAMYASIKEYGGFYIARYEAGALNDRTPQVAFDQNGNVILEDKTYSMMNKYPYGRIGWNSDDSITSETGGAVEAARAMYPQSNSKFGVVSTLTYGVQWDTTIEWFLRTCALPWEALEVGTAYGNYHDHKIESYEQLNSGAKYSLPYFGEFDGDIQEDYSREIEHLYTTGALKAAKINNIYDMAGNMAEWTMEGYSTNQRVLRGGSVTNDGDGVSISQRYHTIYFDDTDGLWGFRVSLYIKK